MNPGPAAPLPSYARRSRHWRHLGLLAALTVAVVLASLWYRGRKPSPLRPPEVDLAEVDPEVAAALQEARDAVERDAGSAVAWGILATKFHTCRYYPQALACYAEAERLDPGSADWPYLRALILASGPSPGEAIAPLRNAVARDTGKPLPRLRLGEALLEQGRADEAEAQFRAVLANDPAEPRACLRLAQLAASRQQWRDCLRHLEPAAAAPPARKQVCGLRLRAYESLGDEPAAEREQRLLADLPEDPPWPDPIFAEWLGLTFGLQARLNLARDLLRQQQGAEAISLLQDTVQKYPDSARAWDTLGWVFGTLGHFSQAEQAFQTSLKLAPDQGNVWFSLGLMRLKQNKLDAGLTAIHEAARLRPTDTRAHCKIGACLASKGDREGAAAAYREALRYQPDLREAREGLARLRPETLP